MALVADVDAHARVEPLEWIFKVHIVLAVSFWFFEAEIPHLNVYIFKFLFTLLRKSLVGFIKLVKLFLEIISLGSYHKQDLLFLLEAIVCLAYQIPDSLFNSWWLLIHHPFHFVHHVELQLLTHSCHLLSQLLFYCFSLIAIEFIILLIML